MVSGLRLVQACSCEIQSKGARACESAIEAILGTSEFSSYLSVFSPLFALGLSEIQVCAR
jgi:hypothetical protein